MHAAATALDPYLSRNCALANWQVELVHFTDDVAAAGGVAPGASSASGSLKCLRFRFRLPTGGRPKYARDVEGHFQLKAAAKKAAKGSDAAKAAAATKMAKKRSKAARGPRLGMADLRGLLLMAFHFIDKVAQTRLSAKGREKSKEQRRRRREEAFRAGHAARQEAAAAKKEKKLKKEKEAFEAMTPEQQRKEEERRYKRQQRKRMGGGRMKMRMVSR